VLTLSEGLAPRRVLVIGAHSDDIEIGAGGSILALRERDPELAVNWVVLAAHGDRRQEALDSARRFVTDPDRLTVTVEGFKERYFPYQPEIKEYFDHLGREVSPDLVLCPWIEDAHQDHRTTATLALNTFRHHLILQYEIPKSDGDLGRPTVFLDVSKDQARRKVDLVMEGFPSQHGRRWFDREVFFGLMRLRGMESHSKSGYAEAFHCRKLKLVGT
jgi:LmbE family N-acetylglucosaminyl deacetylase